ncbi:hypothetical protein PLAPEKGO_00142 [Klebsiella phage KP6]|nr:hypothetical protein GHCGIGKI_00115 [Klebsiella phage P01]
MFVKASYKSFEGIIIPDAVLKIPGCTVSHISESSIVVEDKLFLGFQVDIYENEDMSNKLESRYHTIDYDQSKDLFTQAYESILENPIYSSSVIVE